MPTELEELVEFLHHGNTQIRQIATENLVPYSKAQPSIFKTGQLTPVKDLKLLVRDYTEIARDALTILVNISGDAEILKELAEDDAFLETVLARVTSPKEPNANTHAMLLANLAKSPSLERLIALERKTTIPELSPSHQAITQLIELYNRGGNGGWNKDADYDYLAFLFADLAKYSTFTDHVTEQDVRATFLPLTTHPSQTRRHGTALLLKNVVLAYPDMPSLLQPRGSILPALLLPLLSSETEDSFSEEEMDQLPPECQFLGPDHRTETDIGIMRLLTETLVVICEKGGSVQRQTLKAQSAYAVIRELHLRVEDEGVRGMCERFVDLIMMDPEVGVGERRVVMGEARGANMGSGGMVEEVKEEVDEEDEIVPIF